MQSPSPSQNFITLKNQDEYGCHSNYPPAHTLTPDDTVLKLPCRTPLVVIETLRPYIEDKVICEIGSALGDIILKMKKYAKAVYGIEIDKEYANYSKKRGLDTRFGDALKLLPLPEKIDVYYMWMNPKPTRQIFDAIKSGTIIMAGELGLETEKANSPRGIEVKILDEIHAENPDSQMLEINYHEGDGKRQSGTLVLLVVKK